MKKSIVLTNGVVKEMSFEEVLKQFNAMLNRHANVMVSKFEKYVEKEDVMQDLKMATWQAFEEYDEKHAFSTLLTYKLRGVTGNQAQKITAKKREHNGVVSMNAEIDDTDNLTFEGVHADEDYTDENIIAREMMALINSDLNEKEQEELRCILYPKSYSVADLAISRGCSRPAAYQRVNKTKMKLQNLLLANEYATC